MWSNCSDLLRNFQALTFVGITVLGNSFDILTACYKSPSGTNHRKMAFSKAQQQGFKKFERHLMTAATSWRFNPLCHMVPTRLISLRCRHQAAEIMLPTDLLSSSALKSVASHDELSDILVIKRLPVDRSERYFACAVLQSGIGLCSKTLFLCSNHSLCQPQ